MDYNYNHSIKILLVMPSYPSSPFPGPELPTGLGYIAERLEAKNIDYEVSDVSIDGKDLLFRKIKRYNPEYVAVSLISLDIFHNYQLIENIKNAFPDIKIIAGGPHISFVKEKSLKECNAIDFGFVNEGEYSFIEFLEGNDLGEIGGLIYRDNKKVIYEDVSFISDLDEIPFPKYKKFELSKYGDTMQLVSSRGCPFSCTFCGAFLSMGRKWRARSVENLIEEIQYWYNRGYRKFNFVDSNFFMSQERVIELCDALEENALKITMTSDGMRAKDASYEMLKKIKNFGLTSVAVGIESANDDILKNIKKAETLEDMARCLTQLSKLDIAAVGFFIIGLPGETFKHVLNSFKFALSFSAIKYAYFFNVNPLFGTELYSWAKQNDFLLISDRQIYDNIGGMGNEILVKTPELSVRQRKILYFISKYVSRLVELKYRLNHKLRRMIR